MQSDDIARVVATALFHFEGSRYRLAAWCVMPNHVHTVMQPLPGYEVPGIVHAWKSFTAKQANRLIRQAGQLWQPKTIQTT